MLIDDLRFTIYDLRLKPLFQQKFIAIVNRQSSIVNRKS